MSFRKVMHHRFPDRSTMSAFDASVTRFHQDAANHRFQRDHVFFPCRDRIERHQSTSNDDRIQRVVRTVNLVLAAQMCLNIFRRHGPVTATTNNPLHLLIDDAFDFPKLLVLYN